VGLEGLGQLTNPIISSEIKPAQTLLYILWRVYPLLGNRQINTQPFLSKGSINTPLKQQLLETIFSIRSDKVVINERTAQPVQLRGVSPTVNKGVSWKCAAVKRRPYVCYSYSETYNYSVKIRCQDTTSED
jgi:hypothetical protein